MPFQKKMLVLTLTTVGLILSGCATMPGGGVK